MTTNYDAALAHAISTYGGEAVLAALRCAGIFGSMSEDDLTMLEAVAERVTVVPEHPGALAIGWSEGDPRPVITYITGEHEIVFMLNDGVSKES